MNNDMITLGVVVGFLVLINILLIIANKFKRFWDNANNLFLFQNSIVHSAARKEFPYQEKMEEIENLVT